MIEFTLPLEVALSDSYFKKGVALQSEKKYMEAIQFLEIAK
jgi:hypothetical protein